MTDSRKIRALLIAGVLAALVAIPAFADSRLQGTFVFDGDIHAAVIMNGPNALPRCQRQFVVPLRGYLELCLQFPEPQPAGNKQLGVPAALTPVNP